MLVDFFYKEINCLNYIFLVFLTLKHASNFIQRMYVLFSKFCDNINFLESIDSTSSMETLTTLNPMPGRNKTAGKYA